MKQVPALGTLPSWVLAAVEFGGRSLYLADNKGMPAQAGGRYSVYGLPFDYDFNYWTEDEADARAAFDREAERLRTGEGADDG